jgi:fumarate hydratase class II
MRRERDSLGAHPVPTRALYGLFTQRARETFQLSGQPPPAALLRAYARIKLAAARVNGRLGLLPRTWARAVEWGAARVAAGLVPDAAAVDSLQAGAGTPTHMNINEVVANLANERLGGRRGRYAPIHPNNHVNLGQSSNDVTPTAIRLMALELRRPLLDEVAGLTGAFQRLARRERAVVKPGRTHLQDAVPITYGQVFDGYAESMRQAAAALETSAGELRRIGLGGTAVGTGITSHPDFGRLVARELGRLVGEPLRPARNLATATWSLRPLLGCSAALRGVAVDLGKICFDLRLLASGPHTGLGELRLPEVEPGSSIMPGKVNPSVPEAVQMVCYQVTGLDHAIALAAAGGELELNVMTPLVAYDLAQSFELLTRAVRLLRVRCVEDLAVDRRRVRTLLENSLIEATALAPYLGYEVMAELVKEARATGRSLRELLQARGLIDGSTLDRILAAPAVTRPGRIDPGLRRKLQHSAAYQALRRQLH